MPARWRRVRLLRRRADPRTAEARPMYRRQPPRSSTATSTGSASVTAVLRVGGGGRYKAATPRDADHREQVSPFIVGVTSSAWSTSGRTSTSGVRARARRQERSRSGPGQPTSSSADHPRETRRCALLERSGSRQECAEQADGHRRADAEVPRAADLLRRGVADVDLAELERSVRVRVRSTRPTTKWPRLPFPAGTPASITLHLQAEIESRRHVVRRRRRLGLARSHETGHAHQCPHMRLPVQGTRIARQEGH
jgi:hypothetical protein